MLCNYIRIACLISRLTSWHIVYRTANHPTKNIVYGMHTRVQWEIWYTSLRYYHVKMIVYSVGTLPYPYRSIYRQIPLNMGNSGIWLGNVCDAERWIWLPNLLVYLRLSTAVLYTITPRRSKYICKLMCTRVYRTPSVCTELKPIKTGISSD